MTCTKDHGLLFTDEMVRAYLAGRKVQTRRPIKWAVNQCGEPADHLCQIGTTGRWTAWWGPASQEACQRLTDRAYRAREGARLEAEYDGKRPASMDYVLEELCMTEDELIAIAKSHAVPPTDFKPGNWEMGPKLHDQDQWDRTMPEWLGRNEAGKGGVK